jgi:hypothetical protein
MKVRLQPRQPLNATVGICLMVVVAVLAGCGGGGQATALMPDVQGLRLDVAISDIEAQGVAENDIEVVGGGSFGVVDESNWVVCEQRPQAGTAIVDVRLIVDRVCSEDDSSTPAASMADEAEKSDEPTVAAAGTQKKKPERVVTTSPVEFALMAGGDISDFRKDLGDAREALSEGGFIRMSTNLLEMEFNLGQLEAAEPPASAKAEWNAALREIEKSLDAYSNSLDGDALQGVAEALDRTEAALDTAEAIVQGVA